MSAKIFLRAVDALCKEKLDPSFAPAPWPDRPAKAGAPGRDSEAVAAAAEAGACHGGLREGKPYVRRMGL